MPLTAAAIQNAIILRTGDLDPATGDPPSTPEAGVLRSNIELIWSLYADKASIWPRLQEFYTQRDCLDALIAVRRPFAVKVGLGNVTVDPSGMTAVLQAERASIQAAIDKAEALATVDADSEVDELSTVEPVSPPTFDTLPAFGPPNANDPIYSGSAYRHGRFVSP